MGTKLALFADNHRMGFKYLIRLFGPYFSIVYKRGLLHAFNS